MSRPWILVCPSSRGVGYALTRHLLKNTTAPILATARGDPSSVKKNLLKDISDSEDYSNRLSVVQVDVTKEDTVKAASKQAKEFFPPDTHHLHLGFAIPGILHAEKSPQQVDLEKALMTYRVNTLGPLLLMKWFEEFLPRKRTEFALNDSKGSDSQKDDKVRLPDHAVWLNMSARVGSVSDNRLGGWYSYRSSKAAVNSLTRSFDVQLYARSGDRAMAMAYHPGTVKTDLSKDYWDSVERNRLFSPEDAAKYLVDVATGRVGLEGRGKCWDYKAEEVLP